jgi:hypothetical protein
MSLVSRLQELFDERRGDARNAVSRPADLLINAAFPPEEGASLVLRCAQVEVPARVVWVRHYRFGLRFDQKIEARQVASLVKPDEAYIF